MYINKFDERGSYLIDKKATDLFLDICQRKSVIYSKSSKEEDIFEHWDYRIQFTNIDWKVDLKGLKRINSQDTSSDDSLILIELANVNGNDGWLYGKATHIVFLIQGCFLFVNREELVKLVQSKIDLDGEVKESTQYKEAYIIYQRKQWGRKDKFVYLPRKDLVTIAEGCWKI